MDERFRLVIIGAGAAGLSAAITARRMGVSAAVVESGRPGGISAWAGGVPTSALFNAASVATTIRTASRFGIQVEKPVVDFGEVMRQVRSAIETVLAENTAELAGGREVRLISGNAEFLDPRTILAGDTRIRARQIIIATGSRPIIPAIPGLETVPYLLPETIFELSGLPGRLIVLGGGASGCELGQAFARLGSRVTIVEQTGRLLPLADADASAAIARRFEAEGISTRFSQTLSRIDRDDEGLVADLEDGPIGADAILIATGRTPSFDGLELGRVGVIFDEEGVRVDEKLQTSTPGIFAAGDVIGSSQFTHYAAYLGAAAARNAILPLPEAVLRHSVPWCTVTDPGVAQVGLTEQQARGRHGEIRVVRRSMSEIDLARTEGETDGFLKLIAKPDGLLLGASIVSHRAAELANILSLALEQKLKLATIATSLQVSPSYGEAASLLAGVSHARGLRAGLGGVLRRLLSE